MRLFRCLTTYDLVVTAILFAAFTALWITGYTGFVGWTSFILVPILLAAGRHAKR